MVWDRLSKVQDTVLHPCTNGNRGRQWAITSSEITVHMVCQVAVMIFPCISYGEYRPLPLRFALKVKVIEMVIITHLCVLNDRMRFLRLKL